jgi:hypothetical protein
MTPANQNCIHEEIKSRFVSENDCYHSVHEMYTETKQIQLKIHATKPRKMHVTSWDVIIWRFVTKVRDGIGTSYAPERSK